MVRRLLVTLVMLTTIFAAQAQRKGEMLIQGTMCSYDTLIHRSIAPGATYTLFQFDDFKVDKTTYKMRTHLIAIDNTNPYSSVATYMTKDDYFAGTNQQKEVQRRKKLGQKPVASINGSTFTQSNLASSTSQKYELQGSFVTDGVIKYGDGTSRLNYYMDEDSLAHMLWTHFGGRVTKADETSFDITQLNHSRAYSNNKLALFCNGITKTNAGSTDQGTEIVIKKKDGSQFVAGDNVCEVVRILSGSFNTIGKDEAALSGEGEAGEFLDGMQIGDEITITLDHFDAEGNKLNVTQMMAALGNEPYVRNGEVVPYGAKKTAQAALGFSQDGKTTYWVQLEISEASDAPAICFIDFMVAAGIWDAIKLDGGPSAEITIDGEWATTSSVGAGFNGRIIPAGLMLYSVAPDDNKLATVECYDPSLKKLKRGDSYTFELWGYNQYGEMINSHAEMDENVTYSCPEKLGTFDRNTFTANKAGGEGDIEIKVTGNDDFALRIPVSVEDNRSLTVSPKTFFTGEGRSCQATLEYIVENDTTAVDPALAKWSTDNTYAIKSCEKGLIEPFVDGFAEVYVEYEDLTDTIKVTVENLEEEVASLRLTEHAADASQINYQLPSVPYSIDIRLKASPSTGKPLTLHYKTGETEQTYTIEMSETETTTFNVAFDYDNPATYPITLLNITGEEGQEINIEKLMAYYTLETKIENLTVETSGIQVHRNGKTILLQNDTNTATNCVAEVYTLQGTQLIRESVTLSKGESILLPCLYTQPVLVKTTTEKGVSVVKCY